MQGKVVVITGATSGIGQVAAESLAQQGARIVLVARDRARAAIVLGRLRPIGAGAAHAAHYADLSSIADTKRVAAEIAAAEPCIDVLINNAGALFNRRKVSADGLEMTFALNHMSYFVLTSCLKDSLAAAASPRVVNTASAAHVGAKLDFDDLQASKSFSGFKAYGRSKLCNILFTREYARRAAGGRIAANCLHPGFVATRFGDRSGGLLQAVLPLAKLFAISPEKGADTITYLASSPDVAGVAGQYFYQRRQTQPSPQAQDAASAARLWAISLKLAGMDE
jgi:NAD(P)-dependent dehydrogenase (short-subunit alcohol dehydrogenase family)